MKIGIGIPTRDRPDYLIKCLESLLDQIWVDFHVCIVNDNSNKMLVKLPSHLNMLDIDIIEGPRKGPPWAHQAALNHLSECDLIMRVDDDVTLYPDTIVKLSGMFSNPEVCIVGPIVWWGTETFNKYINDYNRPRVHWYGHVDAQAKEVRHIGTTFMYRVSAAKKIGGWPLEYSRVAYREEADFCFRMRYVAKGKVIILPTAFSFHHLAPSGGIDRKSKEYAALEENDIAVFKRRMKEIGCEDPDSEIKNNFIRFWG